MNESELERLRIKIAQIANSQVDSKRITIEDLYHAIRAIKASSKHDKFMIVGSQALLGHFLNKTDFMFSFVESRDIDIVPVIRFKGEVEAEFLKEIEENVFAAQGESSVFLQLSNITLIYADLTPQSFLHGGWNASKW